MSKQALLAGMLAVSCGAQAEAQSLGEAARREKERRGKLQEQGAAGKTYTDDDIAGLAPEGSVPSASPAPGLGPRPAGGAVQSGEAPERWTSGGGETYWRGRVDAARTAIARAEQRVRDLEANAARAGPGNLNPGGPLCQEGHRVLVCQSDVQDEQRARAAIVRLESARASLERLRRALSDLEEEARRRGALPGWLR